MSTDHAVIVDSVGETGAAYIHHRIDKHGKATEDKSLGEFKGPHQETKQPWRTTADDLKFPMLSDGDYIDSLSMLGVTPDGNVVLCQLLVTNLGMSARVGIQFKWSSPTGVVGFHKDEYPVKNLKFSEDGLTWTVEKHLFKWDPAANTGTAQINFEKEKIKADLQFHGVGGGYKIGNGLVSFGAKKFQFLAYPAPRSIVSGTISCPAGSRDLGGATGFISHAFQNMKSHHIACRWHMVKFHAHASEITCNINIGIAPKSHDNVEMPNAVLIRGDKMITCGTNAHADMSDLEVDKVSGYSVPQRVTYRFEGLDEHGKKVTITMPVEKTNVVERLDILSTLPWVLKQFIKAFIAKPYFYVMINEIEAVITHETTGEERIKGWIVHEIMYLNPEHVVDHAKDGAEKEKAADNSASPAKGKEPEHPPKADA